MSVVSFAFTSPLSGREIVIDCPQQRCPFEAAVGAVVAPVAQAQAKVAPQVLGPDTPPAVGFLFTVAESAGGKSGLRVSRIVCKRPWSCRETPLEKDRELV
jgi:hypothetical protein